MVTEAILVKPLTPDATHPAIRDIEWSDLGEALREGYADFAAKPSHMVMLCAIYPIMGLFIATMAVREDLLTLIFPMAAGFALLGPFAALGLYELSRRRERKLDTSWTKVFGVFHSPSLTAIGEVGMVLMVIFLTWLGVAQLIYDLTLGPALPVSMSRFAHEVLVTPAGWMLIIFGVAFGAVFAGLALTVGIVSVPMLVDRPVGFTTAVSTSARCLAKNPSKLLAWGVIVGMMLVVGSIPLFVGLAVAIPILGHASWHLYRKLVEA